MIDYLFSPNKKRQYVAIMGDTVVLLASIVVAYLIRINLLGNDLSLQTLASKLNPFLTLYAVVTHLFVCYLLNLYDLNRLIGLVRLNALGNLVRHCMVPALVSIWLASTVLSASLFFVPKYIFGRQVLLLHLLFASLLFVLWRVAFCMFLTRKNKLKRVAIIGNAVAVTSFHEEITQKPNTGFKLVGFFATRNNPTSLKKVPATVRRFATARDLLHSRAYDVLAFDCANASFSNEEAERILQLKYAGKSIYDLAFLHRNLFGEIPLHYIDGRWLISRGERQGRISNLYLKMKRVFDLVVSFTLLVLSSPLFLVASIAIKYDSKGSIFFTQIRVGKNRKAFVCPKFRTMVEDAEGTSGPVWSEGDDPRITSIGRILRKTRMDELPQLWNILKGEMSFVGPRPIREHFANILRKEIPFYELRFAVKPGLSGWAQVKHDYGASVEGQRRKFEYELFYIENMSLFLDAFIFLKTIQTVLFGKGQ